MNQSGTTQMKLRTLAVAMALIGATLPLVGWTADGQAVGAASMQPGSAAYPSAGLSDPDPAIRRWYLTESYDSLPLEALRRAWHDRVSAIRNAALSKMGAQNNLREPIPGKTRGLMDDPAVRKELKGLIAEFPDDAELASNVISLFRQYPEEGVRLAAENQEHHNFDVQFMAAQFLAAHQVAKTPQVSRPEQLADWDRWSPAERRSLIYSLAINRVIGGSKDTPKEILDALIQQMGDKYPSSDVSTRRVMMLAMRGRYAGHPAYQGLLKAATKDSDPAVRSEIIGRYLESSGDIPDSFVQDILKGDDVRLRRKFAQGKLAKEHLLALPALYSDADPEVATRALMNPQGNWLDKQFLPARLEILRRVAASDALYPLLPPAHAIKKQIGRNGDPYSSVLGILLSSPNGFNRAWAATVMTESGDDAAMAVLKSMSSDRAFHVQLIAISMLGDIASDEARLHLESLLSRNARHQTVSILHNLGRIGMRQSWPAIVPFLYDNDAKVRRNAVSALGRIGAVEASGQIGNLLNDEAKSVRVAAIEAIGAFGLKASTSTIRDSLQDPDPEIQGIAIEALEKLGYGEADFQVATILKGIRERKDTSAWRAESAAISYLGKFSSQKATAVLTEILADRDNSVVSKVIDILGKTGDKKAAPALVQVMVSKERDKSVRDSAAQALGKMQAVESWPSLVEAGKQGVRVIEPLAQLNRLSEAGPELLKGDVTDENLRANLEGLLLAFPREAEPYVRAQLEKEDADSAEQAAGAVLILGLMATDNSDRALELWGSEPEMKKYMQTLLSSSSNDDRRHVLKPLTEKAMGVIRRSDMDSPLLFAAMQGDQQLMEQLADRDASTISRDELQLVEIIVLLHREPRLEKLLASLISSFEDGGAAELLGRNGYLARDDVDPKIAELAPKLLVKMLASSPSYGKAWLSAYVTATSQVQDRESSWELFAAAINRKWTSAGAERAQFQETLKTLKQGKTVLAPEAYWLIVDVLKELGATAEALHWANEALGRENRQTPLTASLYLRWQQAELLWRSGRNDEALASLEKIEKHIIPKLNTLEKQWSPKPIDAYTLMLKGGVLNSLGRKAEAVRALYDAEDRLLLASSELTEGLGALIRSYRADAQRESAKADARAALGYFDQENRKDATRLQQDAEELALETQIKLSLGDGNYEEAHRLAERLALRRYSAQAGGDVASRSPERQAALDGIKRLRQRVQEVEERMRQVTPAKGEQGQKEQANGGAAGENAQAQLAELKKQRAMAQRKLKEYFVSLKADHPEIASLVGAEPVELARLQKLLAPAQVLVQYLFLKDRGWAFVAKHDGVDIVELPVGRGNVGNAVNRYRQALQQSAPARGRRQVMAATTGGGDDGQWLAMNLIQPLQPHLENAQHVVVIPHGDLHSLPFATLPYRKGHLIESFAVSQLPSASLWPLASDGSGTRIGRLLALGNPSPPSPEWTPLPGAESEVRSIKTKFPSDAVEAHFGKDASRRQLLDQPLSNSSIHLALHGEAGSIANTRLVMSDGYLGVKEIWGLAMDNSPLVVLSACETALGEHLPGDEVTSLTNGFMFAGAKSVVGSLWKVPDEPTKLLMEHFYDGLLQGKSPAAALALAQRQLIRSGHPPMAWGAFIVAGR